MNLTLELEGVDRQPVFHAPFDTDGFARRVYTARRRLFRSREVAALEMGISEKSLEAYETGARVPRADTLLILARGLRVSLAWLLAGRADVTL